LTPAAPVGAREPAWRWTSGITPDGAQRYRIDGSMATETVAFDMTTVRNVTRMTIDH